MKGRKPTAYIRRLSFELQDNVIVHSSKAMGRSDGVVWSMPNVAYNDQKHLLNLCLFYLLFVCSRCSTCDDVVRHR